MAEWRAGYRPKVDAEVAATELGRIEAEHGTLLPQDVVDAAKDQESPLHAVFTWNNREAADRYRLVQARGLIRALVIVSPASTEDEKKTVRSFLRVPGGYQSTPSVMARPDLKHAVLRQAWRDLLAFRKRYAHLEEFGALFRTIETMDMAAD